MSLVSNSSLFNNFPIQNLVLQQPSILSAIDNVLSELAAYPMRVFGVEAKPNLKKAEFYNRIKSLDISELNKKKFNEIFKSAECNGCIKWLVAGQVEDAIDKFGFDEISGQITESQLKRYIQNLDMSILSEEQYNAIFLEHFHLPLDEWSKETVKRLGWLSFDQIKANIHTHGFSQGETVTMSTAEFEKLMKQFQVEEGFAVGEAIQGLSSEDYEAFMKEMRKGAPQEESIVRSESETEQKKEL